VTDAAIAIFVTYSLAIAAAHYAERDARAAADAVLVRAYAAADAAYDEARQAADDARTAALAQLMGTADA
jgi:hypothetical protein